MYLLLLLLPHFRHLAMTVYLGYVRQCLGHLHTHETYNENKQKVTRHHLAKDEEK